MTNEADKPSVEGLIARIRKCESMIGRMCAEGQPPLMSIPVDAERDEDIFICDTFNMIKERLASAAAPASQPATPLREVLSDDDLKELAYSAHGEAMSFGLSVDTFMRYFKTIRDSASEAAPAALPATPLREVLMEQIKQAIKDYHYALDTRQHGGVAQDKAYRAIEDAMGLPWRQGEELRSRLDGEKT